jgi:hypothetical protein
LATSDHAGPFPAASASQRPVNRPDKSPEVAGMKRTPINPSSWSINLGFDQGELVEMVEATAAD